MEFMVIQPKTPMEGHPLILGRPLLATVDAFISCRKGEMTISNGLIVKKLNLYQPTQLAVEDPLWLENPYGDDEIKPLLTIEQSQGLQEQIEENILDQFLSTTNCDQNLDSIFEYDHIFSEEFQESCNIEDLASSSSILVVNVSSYSCTMPIEISLGNFLHI